MNLRGELLPLLFIERRRELSKQLPTLVEKTQIFYLEKEFALFGPVGVCTGERITRHFGPCG
jgi:hypothetical protein